MPISPDTDNYSLGKGIVYFNKLVSGAYLGARDLGNTPALTLSVAMDKLDHWNQRSGLRSKDKTVITELTPTVTFQLDEINVENIALMFMADKTEVVQSATEGLTMNIPSSLANRYYDTGYRGIGVWTLPYDALSGGPFEIGEVVSGATGTGTVLRDSGTMLYVAISVAGFVDDETITGAASSATASVDSSNGEIWVTDDAVVRDGTSVFYDKTTDFTVDSVTGRIFLVDGTGIADATDIDVDFGCSAVTYTRIGAFQETVIEGLLHFIPNNPVGPNMELKIWRVDLTPDGEIGMIGDDWQLLPFTGEILKDETGHPTSPYMDVITLDTV